MTNRVTKPVKWTPLERCRTLMSRQIDEWDPGGPQDQVISSVRVPTMRAVDPLWRLRDYLRDPLDRGRTRALQRLRFLR